MCEKQIRAYGQASCGGASHAGREQQRLVSCVCAHLPCGASAGGGARAWQPYRLPSTRLVA